MTAATVPADRNVRKLGMRMGGVLRTSPSRQERAGGDVPGMLGFADAKVKYS
jgi:hypothetical protein